MPPRIFDVLLIEDDNLDAYQIQKSLDKAALKYNLIRAENGEAAQNILNEMIHQNKSFPHFILLDLNMPRMNGLEFLQWLRSQNATKAISVFILTSSTDPKGMAVAYELNVAGYIVKPIDHSQFHDSLEKLKSFLDVCEFPS